MYTLRFNEDLVGRYKNTDECFSMIKDYVSNTLKFKSYYYQCSYLGNEKIIVDYGNHTNFFYIEKEVEH